MASLRLPHRPWSCSPLPSYDDTGTTYLDLNKDLELSLESVLLSYLDTDTNLDLNLDFNQDLDLSTSTVPSLAPGNGTDSDLELYPKIDTIHQN